MDYEFPQQLFPSFYNCGPPDSVLGHCAGTWGSYDRVRPQGGSCPPFNWTFTSRHQVRGETWRLTEPIPIPLLSPKNFWLWPSEPPDPLDFREHMQNFFMDHCQDAFGCMGEILAENFNFKQGVKERYRKDSVHMWKVKSFLDLLKFKICQQSYSSRSLNAYSSLLSDVVPSIPTELLGSLLYEELMEQRDRLLFSEGATGGALAFIPFSQSSSGSQHGCLLYPGNQGLDRLNFHKVELQHHRGSSSILKTSSSYPVSFQLKGPIRQISSTSLLDNCCVAVRSDHMCGVWRFSEREEPRLLQVVNTREVATCISVSPHILGEVLVASESGAANLWIVGKGMQKVREEESNLYFNAKSSWRWCDFSAHPRVMLYADRTGVELTDIRVSPANGHTLFRISSTSECRSGERLILSRYLGDVHSFHHLITTQYSAYIMDERFPCMPMLKWDHMMQSPPMFCHVLPGSASAGSIVGGARTTKVLLGSHHSQEMTLLQYSGGRAEACFSRGPAQALLRPRDSLKHLPVQIPHRLDTATKRLSSPAAGLTCVQKKGGKEAGGEECICVLQLTEAGDIFYQILEQGQKDTDSSQPPAAEDEPLPQQAARKLLQPTQKEAMTLGRRAEQLAPDSQLVRADMSSDEDIIGPTQDLAVPRFVSETPEREQQGGMYSDSEDSELGWKSRKLKQLGLQVIVNEDQEPDHVSKLDSGVKVEKLGGDEVDGTREPSGVEETICCSSSSNHISSSEQQTLVKLSQGALVTWKRWLQKLMQKSHKKEPRPGCSQHLTIQTKDFLHLADEARDLTEEERVKSLRRDLRACMSKRTLLVHSSLSTSISTQDLVPLPNPVDTDIWRDQLSRRLTLSWQGEEAWRAWWEDHLGLNREEKVNALRRKRRREKDAKRAAGRRLDLSGSFTSSLSYQSDLDNFSSSTGWSSAASQGVGSDTDWMAPLSQLEDCPEHGTPRATTPSTVQNDSPVSTPTPTPRSVREKHGDQQIPSSPCLSQTTAASHRRNRRPVEDYFSSLFAPQDEPSQHNIDFLEEGSSMQPPPVSSSASQFRSSQSFPQRSLRVDLSQDSSNWSGLSQSLSQSSQGRLGLSQASQASQPKKKKSRMGF